MKEIKFSEPNIFYRRDVAKGAKAIAPFKEELYKEKKGEKNEKNNEHIVDVNRLRVRLRG